MRYLIYTFYIILIVGLNIGVFPALSIGYYVPNLVAISAVVAIATLEDESTAFFLALLGGIYWELFTGQFVGSLTIGYTLGLLGVIVLSRKVFFIQDRVKYLPLFLLAFQAITLVWQVVWLSLGVYFEWPHAGASITRMFAVAPGMFLYNLVLLYPVYIVLSKVEEAVVFIERRRRGIS